MNKLWIQYGLKTYSKRNNFKFFISNGGHNETKIIFKLEVVYEN